MPTTLSCRCPSIRGPSAPLRPRRLLWRAGFGPRPGEDRALAARGLDGAVGKLLTTGPDNLVGRPPEGQRPPPLPARQVRPRPSLVARPDGAHEPAADRADDARLARLVRDLERDRRLAAPDDPPEQHVPRAPGSARSRARHARDREPGDAAVPERAREREGRAERELRPRADGALHARPRLRLHGARRAGAGTCADGLHGALPERLRLGEVPLRPQPPRRRDEGGVRQARRRTAGSSAVKLDDRAPGPQDVLHPQALGLLHPGARRRRDAGGARSALRAVGLLDEAGSVGDPQAPSALRGAADGEAAGRLPRRDAADPRRPHLDRGLGLAVDPGGPAAVLPAERVGLERRPLARHVDVPRPLAHRAARAREARLNAEHTSARGGAGRPREARRPRRSATGGSRSPTRPAARCSRTPRRRWRPPSPTTTARGRTHR